MQEEGGPQLVGSGESLCVLEQEKPRKCFGLFVLFWFGFQDIQYIFDIQKGLKASKISFHVAITQLKKKTAQYK